MARKDGRSATDVRPIEIIRRFTTNPPGSVLYRCGNTHVFVTAMIDERVPGWMAGRGKGWVTAEYGMLPGSTGDRKQRARTPQRLDGRTQEIQRLVGRALRSVTNMKALGERTVWLDCDVIQADGGTRTACINAAYIALCDALRTYKFKRPLSSWPLTDVVGAISVGIVGGEVLTDLAYNEDHRADVDMNVVATASGKFLEVQGTAEAAPFDRDQLGKMLDHAKTGIDQVLTATQNALKTAPSDL